MVDRARARRAGRSTATAIVDTAMAIVDDEGLDGLSMRAVADRLGTGPASLYAHVSGRDELLMLLLERAAADIVVPDPEPERWQEQVSEVACSMRDALAPTATSPARRWRTSRPASTRCASPTGSSPSCSPAASTAGAAAMVIDLLPQLVVNDVYEGSLFARRLEQQPDYFERLHEYWSSMPADRFPHVAALADEIGGGGEDEGDVRFASRWSSSSPASRRGDNDDGAALRPPRVTTACRSSPTPAPPARRLTGSAPSSEARPRRPPRRACARA